MPPPLLRALRSPMLRSAAVLAGGGLGFALGTILLARILPKEEFGLVSLLLSLLQVGAALGSLGLPTLVNRHQLRAGGGLLRHAIATGSAAAIVLMLFALYFYRMPDGIAWLLGLAVFLAAIARVAGSVLQSHHRFGTSLFLTQAYNWLLLASVPLVLAFHQRSAAFVALVVAASCLSIAFVGWQFAARASAQSPETIDTRLWWSEGLSAAGFGLALNLFFQLDRLVIGRVLSLHELATYSVVAAVAGSPFRMLQVAAGHTLVPRLRAAVADGHSPAKLLRMEGFLMAVLSIGSAAILLPLTPALVGFAFKGRDGVSYALVFAVVIVGLIRVIQGSFAAVVSAIGSPRQLSLLSLCGWTGVGVAILLAVALSSHGLIAVIYALGAGWLAVALGAAALAVVALSASTATATTDHPDLPYPRRSPAAAASDPRLSTNVRHQSSSNIRLQR